jgi:DNA-directed RNA polymerase subunit RPC12/RpoP
MAPQPLAQGPSETPAALQRCPGCRTKIVVADREGIVVRNAILRVTRTGHATAKCPRCKAWVEVPLRYTA